MLTPAHVDLYVKMQADSATHAGYRVDAALIFMEFVEIMLGKLDSRDREIALLRSYGYTQEEIADRQNVCVDTISRHVGHIDRTLFEEFIAGLGELGMTMRKRHACKDGRRLGRPPKLVGQ